MSNAIAIVFIAVFELEVVVIIIGNVFTRGGGGVLWICLGRGVQPGLRISSPYTRQFSASFCELFLSS